MKITLENINKVYKKDGYETHALKDAKLQVQQGDQIMVVGPSGSGKSTLLNIIGMIDRDFKGSYQINGKEVAKFSSKQLATMRNTTFGYIFQEYALIESATIYDNVRIPLLYSKVNSRKHRALIEEALHNVGLNDINNKKVRNLSGGQRQRVAIARALVNKPTVILADEPTGSLDGATRDQILNIIYQYVDETKILIFVTHDLSVNRRGEQRIINISEGLLSKMMD